MTNKLVKFLTTKVLIKISVFPANSMTKIHVTIFQRSKHTNSANSKLRLKKIMWGGFMFPHDLYKLEKYFKDKSTGNRLINFPPPTYIA